MTTRSPAEFDAALFAYLDAWRPSLERITKAGDIAVCCFEVSTGAADLIVLLGGGGANQILVDQQDPHPGNAVFRMTRRAQKEFAALMRLDHDTITHKWLRRRDWGGDFRVFVLHGASTSFLVNYQAGRWAYEPGSRDAPRVTKRRW